MVLLQFISTAMCLVAAAMTAHAIHQRLMSPTPKNIVKQWLVLFAMLILVGMNFASALHTWFTP